MAHQTLIYEEFAYRLLLFTKLNFKILLKMDIFVQNCLFLQHFPYY